MNPRNPYKLALAAVLLATLVRPALADSFDLMTSDGPMHVHISRDGDVQGEYPKLQGVLRGHVGPGGAIHGIWLQSRSDHPCNQMRGETYAWGAFTISDPSRRRVSGAWGYCNEQPNRDWDIAHD